MVSVFYAVDGRSVVIIGRGGHPCVALICSVARIAEKKTNEVNRSERRYTVDSVQCFSSKHWAVCPPLLAQPVDFRLSLISNQLKSFEFLRLNTSKFLGLGSWRRSSKVWPRQITSNQPKGGRKLTIKVVGSTMFVPTTNYNYWLPTPVNSYARYAPLHWLG